MNDFAKPTSSRAGLLAALAASVALLIAALGAPTASADLGTEFGLSNVDFTLSNEDGTAATQAGSHAYESTAGFEVNREGEFYPLALYGDTKTVVFDLPAGFVGDSAPTPFCKTTEFSRPGTAAGQCAKETQIGMSDTLLLLEGFVPPFPFEDPLYMLTPPPGKVARFGFRVFDAFPIIVDVAISDEAPYHLVASSESIPTFVQLAGNTVKLWGNPYNAAHDAQRGGSVSLPEKPFLTLPTACMGPQTVGWEGESWQNQGVFESGSFLTHDEAENPQGFTGCGKVPFDPRVSARPSSKAAAGGSGLDFD
ncbi:MAG TPA: hypothetical protein VFC52_04905, partial [Solirubrobacterales bacterium]|nr:hypothetical protein [Solirubrobacterales bacterium]